MNLERLNEPFPLEDIGWLLTATNAKAVQKKGGSSPTKGVFAPYVDNRAIMNRLDSVVGKTHWRNEYAESPDGKGTLCGISILLNGEWVTKWDGAPSDKGVEPVKSALSNSMKRAASQWGIGRYLYNYKMSWVDIKPEYGSPPVKPHVLPKEMLPQAKGLIVPDGVDLIQFALVLGQASEFIIADDLPLAGNSLADVAVDGGATGIIMLKYFAGDYKSKDGYFEPDGEKDLAMQAVAKDLLFYV